MLINVDVGSAADVGYTTSLSPSTSLSDHNCDIGKLVAEGVVLSQLSRDHKYRVLKTEPSQDASTYRRTRPCESSSYRQFQPTWLNKDLSVASLQLYLRWGLLSCMCFLCSCSGWWS